MSTTPRTFPASPADRDYTVRISVDGTYHSEHTVNAPDAFKAQGRALMRAMDAGLRLAGQSVTYDTTEA